MKVTLARTIARDSFPVFSLQTERGADTKEQITWGNEMKFQIERDVRISHEGKDLENVSKYANVFSLCCFFRRCRDILLNFVSYFELLSSI